MKGLVVMAEQPFRLTPVQLEPFSQMITLRYRPA
jgi:hypothetical protein